MATKHTQTLGTPFQKRIWTEIAQIPKGQVITYKELAIRIGKPKATRAVANAVGANPNPITVPCHRVVRSDGTIGGYSGPGGMRAKKKLLAEEGVIF
jgi:methylated-DNA-[protein]-cysteine S-methyltransferase